MHRSRVGLDAQKPGLGREMHKAKFRAHHEKRLDEISRRAPGTGTVDNTAPYTSHLKHLKTRPKKKAILAARDAEVERANRDLLRQMTKIFTTPSTLLPIEDSVDGRGNGLGPCLSINVLCRKRELERIALENKTWMKHLKAVTPSYDAASWERDRAANKKVAERLRTVRYVRGKATPEEFSRRGVRHLRKQVARTRGQALEAGFSPAPCLLGSSGGKRGTAVSRGQKRVRRQKNRTPSSSSSFFSSPPPPNQEEEEAAAKVEDDEPEGIPTGVTVTVKSPEPESTADGGGKDDGDSDRVLGPSSEATAEEAKQADDDDGSQSAYSEFENEGGVEEEEEEEDQQYSEFEDEPKEDDDEDHYSDFGEGESHEEAETRQSQRNGTDINERSEALAELEQTPALASSSDGRLFEQGETSQGGPEAEGEEELGESGDDKAQLDTRRSQDGSGNVKDVGGGAGTSAAAQGDEKPEKDVPSPGKAVPVGSNATTMQPPRLPPESASGSDVEKNDVDGVVEGETCAGKDDSSGIDIDTDNSNGIGSREAVEACGLGESGSDQPNQGDEELHHAGLDDEQPQASHRGLRDGGSDERLSSGGIQAEEGGGDAVESGYRSESFEGDGDTSESAMSGPAPEMVPAEAATEESQKGGSGDTAEAVAVATGPASPSPTAISSSEGQPGSVIEVEGGNGDASPSTPPVVGSSLPLEDHEQPAPDQMPSEGSPPFEESPSPAQDGASSSPPLLVDSGFADESESPAVAMQHASRDPAGDGDPLQEARDDAVRTAVGEDSAAQPALAGEPALTHQPPPQSVVTGGGDGACTSESGVEDTMAPCEIEAASDSAADKAGESTTGAAEARPTASEISKTRAKIEPPADADAGDHMIDDRQVQEPQQSSEELSENDGGSRNVNLEVAPPEDVSTGSPLPSSGLEQRASTTAALSVAGGSEKQSYPTGTDEGGEAGLPPLGREENQSSSPLTPTQQKAEVTRKDGDTGGSNVSTDPPAAPAVPSEEQSDEVSGREAETEVEMMSSVGMVHQTASEPTSRDNRESQPQGAQNREEDSTALEAAEQASGGREDEPSLALAKVATKEDGDLEKAPAKDGVADTESATTGNTFVPEESPEEVTPTAAAESTGDLLVAGGGLLESPTAEDVVGDSATTEKGEPGEAVLVGEDTPARESIDDNSEEGMAVPTSITAGDGAPLDSSSLLISGGKPDGHESPPDPFASGGTVDAPLVSETLESGSGGLSDTGTDPQVIVDDAQDQASGVDGTLSSISVDAGVNSPSPHAEVAEASPNPKGKPPSETDVGDGSGEAGPAAAVVAEEATAPPRTDGEEHSRRQESTPTEEHDASATGQEEASAVCASESTRRVEVQGQDGEPGSFPEEAGHAAVQEEDLVLDGVQLGRETNPVKFDRGDGSSKSFGEVFDDLSTSVEEAVDGSKSEGGAISSSIEEGHDMSVSSLGGDGLGSPDGSDVVGSGNKGGGGTEADGLVGEVLAPASLENKGG